MLYLVNALPSHLEQCQRSTHLFEMFVIRNFIDVCFTHMWLWYVFTMSNILQTYVAGNQN